MSWIDNLYTIVPHGHAVILSNRFTGKVSKVLKAGSHMIWPWHQKVNVETSFGYEKDQNGNDTADLMACKADKAGNATLIELTEQLDDYLKRPCVTKDNVEVTVDTVVSWRILDPIKAVFDVDHLPQSLEQRVLSEVRSQIGQMELEEIFSTRAKLSERIVANISGSLAKWGVTVISVEIQQIGLAKEVKEAMLQQMAAERAARASVLRAEGELKAMEITARAQKAYLQELAGVVSPSDAARILLNMQTLQAYDTICRSDNAKVFLPSNLPATVTVKE